MTEKFNHQNSGIASSVAETVESTLNPVIRLDSTIKRKYAAEAGLHLYSRGPILFRPSDIYRFDGNQQFREALTGSNVYLICRRRRISIDPHSIRVQGGELSGEFLLHGDGYHEWERARFSQAPSMHGLDGRPMRVAHAKAADAVGHALLAIDERGDRFYIPACVLVASTRHPMKDRTRLEVLYVGQTFGKRGNRVAVDRLIDHTTLQRIMAEVADESGQDEILLLGLEYGNAKNMLSSAGDLTVEPSATSSEEQAHLMASGAKTFSRKDRILLAEAALINHFKPKYNVMHLNSFSRRHTGKLKTLRSLLRADFTALIVEVNTSNIGAKLWSRNAPHGAMSTYFTEDKIAEMRDNVRRSSSDDGMSSFNEWMEDCIHAHIAKFPLYQESERETFLHGLPWKN